VRLLPDVPVQGDGVRSTNTRFRNEIEQILNAIIPMYVPEDKLVTLAASKITESFDWGGLLARLLGPQHATGAEPKPVKLFPTLWDYVDESGL
jgi:hypothetical protein